MWVAGTKLLEKCFEHLRVFLDHLPQLLKFSAVSKEIEGIIESRSCSIFVGSTALRREVEKIDVAIVATSFGRRLGRGSGGCGGCGGSGLVATSFLFKVFRNALKCVVCQ